MCCTSFLTRTPRGTLPSRCWPPPTWAPLSPWWRITRAQDYRTDLYLSVTLDASGTMDGEMDPYTLAWRVLERPREARTFWNPPQWRRKRPSIFDQVGIYRVEVTGTDTRGAIGKSVATIRAIRDLALRLTWEPDANAACRSAATPESRAGKTDVDIHLVAPGGMLGDYFHRL